MREFKYMGDSASVSMDTLDKGDALVITVSGFNDSLQRYLSEGLKLL